MLKFIFHLLGLLSLFITIFIINDMPSAILFIVLFIIFSILGYFLYRDNIRNYFIIKKFSKNKKEILVHLNFIVKQLDTQNIKTYIETITLKNSIFLIFFIKETIRNDLQVYETIIYKPDIFLISKQNNYILHYSNLDNMYYYLHGRINFWDTSSKLYHFINISESIIKDNQIISDDIKELNIMFDQYNNIEIHNLKVLNQSKFNNIFRV